jgi:hypothetical protein
MAARRYGGVFGMLAAVVAVLAAGCSPDAMVNQKPLAELMRMRLEAQPVTIGTSLSQMARVYQTSAAFVRRLNAGNPCLGETDVIVREGVLLFPRVSCDATVEPRRKQVRVSCGIILLRVYPCRLGPRAAAVPQGGYLVEKKSRLREDAEANYLGTRLIQMGGGFLIHGGAPPLPKDKARYDDDAVGAEACYQLQDAHVEELYDLLEQGGSVRIEVE